MNEHHLENKFPIKSPPRSHCQQQNRFFLFSSVRSTRSPVNRKLDGINRLKSERKNGNNLLTPSMDDDDGSPFSPFSPRWPGSPFSLQRNPFCIPCISRTIPVCVCVRQNNKSIADDVEQESPHQTKNKVNALNKLSRPLTNSWWTTLNNNNRKKEKTWRKKRGG